MQTPTPTRNLQSYLLNIALEESASKEAELQSLRNSLRYRVGGWILEAFPPGRRTAGVLWRLIRLCCAWRRGKWSDTSARENLVLPVEARRSTTLVFGYTVPSELETERMLWRTNDPEFMARRLDSGAPANTLILRLPASPLLRRLERAKLAGTKVIWWPEASVDFEPALVNYVRGHADECRDELSA
jgi:hypothetical protein